MLKLKLRANKIMDTIIQIKPFAEIIESSLNIWKAQAWQWDEAPSFGSLVTVKTLERTIFGLVSNIEICSADAYRVVTAYKKTEEELKKEQPQIFEFLKTTFSCITIGYQENDILLYQLAPEPPKMHAFVFPAKYQEMVDFFSNEQYLQLLFNFSSHLFSLDELLLSILKQLSDKDILTKDNLEKFIETFSLLTANDYRRLKLFLKRTKSILKQF
ncbi:HAS barrel domain [Candidatus Babela massiliensis]|uniref:HAS barrel domain n=2 Tax=Candidatus Babela massiliensis TaxID=673862 RepID=V6DJG8_9BACT|nr:HAS barrel domain [Candidatus Babela massiliensis]